MKVLVVEDDTSIRESLLELLLDEGYEPRGANNGAEALAILRGGFTPRLILLDLMMPIMDGFQFREEQLKDPALAAIPVVVMSADGNVKEKQARTAAAAYLKKPLDIYELVQTMKTQVGA